MKITNAKVNTSSSTNGNRTGGKHNGGKNKGNGKGGQHAATPLTSDIGQQAVKAVNGLSTDTGIKALTDKVTAVFEGTGKTVGNITVDDTKNPAGLITKLGTALSKCGTVKTYLVGLTDKVAQDLCMNAVISGIMAQDAGTVVPAVKFIPAQREYFQAQGMVYTAQKALNRLNAQSVRESTVVIFQGGVQGLKTMQQIAKDIPAICNFFKPIAVHGFPVDIQGVKILAGMKTWERAGIVQQMDRMAVDGLLNGTFRPDFGGKIISKICGDITVDGGNADVPVAGPFLTAPKTNLVTAADIATGGTGNGARGATADRV